MRKHGAEYLPEVPRLVGGASWNCDLAESRRGCECPGKVLPRLNLSICIPGGRILAV